jgi:glycosyltransferase involved in cell wall biosynthesis
MKILYIISGDIWAGAEAQVYYTLSALIKIRDLSFTCIIFNNGILKDKLESNGIKTILLDETYLNSFMILSKLNKLIQIIKPNFIHVHAVKEHFLAKCSTLFFNNKIPIIRTVHGARKAPDNLPLWKSIRSNLVVFLDNFLIKYAANDIIAVSKNLEEEFYNRKVKSNIHQIYNAIDTHNYNLTNNNNEKLRGKYGTKDLFWIGTAARLAEPKNLQMLIKAGQHLRERAFPFKISIFGDGPLRQELQNLIDRNSLSAQVELHGFEPNIYQVISALDVFVLCSIHEGLPIALLEAMVLKTPVICTDVIGIKEVIENGVNGLLIPLNNDVALAEALITLNKNREFAFKLAHNARILLDEKFSISKSIDQLYKIYNQI